MQKIPPYVLVCIAKIGDFEDNLFVSILGSVNSYFVAMKSLFFLAFAIICHNSFAQEILTPIHVLKTVPHSSQGFTQGLLLANDTLWESIGLYGKSALCKQTISGKLLGCQTLPQNYFAEGLALIDSTLIQITWREQTALRHILPKGKSTLPLRSMAPLSYTGEGWGLAAFQGKLLFTNGSDTLYWMDKNLKVLGKIPLIYMGQKLDRLNELETIGHFILANRWYDHRIFLINPLSGNVLRVYDGSVLIKTENSTDHQAVLNGIAYDAKKDIVYLTGKNWKNMFVARLEWPRGK